jgi:hypothetical protein
LARGSKHRKVIKSQLCKGSKHRKVMESQLCKGSKRFWCVTVYNLQKSSLVGKHSIRQLLRSGSYAAPAAK